MEKAHIKIKIPSDVFYLEPVRAFIGNLAQHLGFSRKRIADIQLAVDEICSNAVDHGSLSTEAEIKLQICGNSQALEILVQDAGTGVAWLTPERLAEIEANRSSNNESGHGIFLAKLLSDTYDIRCNADGGTDVHVIFYQKD